MGNGQQQCAVAGAVRRSMAEANGKVLLYSGGLDSYCAAYVWHPDTLLHVDMGTAYGIQELEKLHKAPLPVTVVDLDLVAWEREDKIIPMRNLLLVTLASVYGDQVGLAATKGDRVLDKSQGFALLATNVLSYLWQPQHWTVGRDAVDVVLPVKHLTKTQLVREALSIGAPPEGMWRDTFSCYTPNMAGAECGECKPCARKWVALKANVLISPNMDAGEYVLREYWPAILNGGWDRGAEEATDVITALRFAGRITAAQAHAADGGNWQ